MSNITNFIVKCARNIGDLSSTPVLYFLFHGKVTVLDAIQDYTYWHNDDDLILGGGGMIHGNLSNICAKIVRRAKGKKIAWGIGHNDHQQTFRGYPAWLKECDLVGLRDYFPTSGATWVPCASCMSPAFDKKVYPKHEFVIYEHHEFPVGIYNEFPRKRNRCRTIEEAVEFIASGEMVITNCYHGMYWATLLGRRCLAIPFSSKFHFFKYEVPHVTSLDWWKSLNRTRVYSEALAECREANMQFYSKVMEVL